MRENSLKYSSLIFQDQIFIENLRNDDHFDQFLQFSQEWQNRSKGRNFHQTLFLLDCTISVDGKPMKSLTTLAKPFLLTSTAVIFSYCVIGIIFCFLIKFLVFLIMLQNLVTISVAPAI